MSLRIMDFPFDPSRITDAIGMEPAATWIKGEKVNPRFGVTHKENGWEIKAEVDKSVEFNEQVKALIALVKPNLERFIAVCPLYYTEISCAVYIDTSDDVSTPWIHLDREDTEFLDGLGASIDFDIYLI